MAVDLLTKTGPISGAVWAREVERLQADAEAFSSLQAVRNKAHLLVTASVLPNADESEGAGGGGRGRGMGKVKGGESCLL